MIFDKSDYTIDDTIVSSSHCTIYAVQFDPMCAPMVYCHDSSLNGTFINDRLIGKGNTEILTNGDIICKFLKIQKLPLAISIRIFINLSLFFFLSYNISHL